MSFSPEKEKSILEVESRRALYELVKRYAGSHFRDLQRKANLSTGSTKYHLDYLNKKGLIKLEKEGRHLRYFPLSFPSKNTALLSFLRQEKLRSILLYILTREHCIQEEIAEFVHLSPGTLSFHLGKLQAQDIVLATKKGRKTHYTLSIDKDELVTLLITYKESFFDSLVNKVVDMWEFE